MIAIYLILIGIGYHIFFFVPQQAHKIHISLKSFTSQNLHRICPCGFNRIKSYILTETAIDTKK